MRKSLVLTRKSLSIIRICSDWLANRCRTHLESSANGDSSVVSLLRLDEELIGVLGSLKSMVAHVYHRVDDSVHEQILW